MAQWKKGAKKAEVEEVEVEDETEALEGEAEVEEDEPELEPEVEEEPEPAPKKKVAKKAPVVEEPEEETTEVEVEEPKAKKGKDKPEKVARTKGAPRARKWNYGITPNSVIKRVKDAEAPKGVADQWDYAKTGTTVTAFLKAGGDRHGLRVMMRGGAIKLQTGAELFPRAWDPAVDKQELPEALRKNMKTKKVVEEEEPAEEEPAPKPVKKAKK